MPFLYDTAKHVLLGCLTNLEQFDLSLAIYCYGQLDVCFFVLVVKTAPCFLWGSRKLWPKWPEMHLSGTNIWMRKTFSWILLMHWASSRTAWRIEDWYSSCVCVCDIFCVSTYTFMYVWICGCMYTCVCVYVCFVCVDMCMSVHLCVCLCMLCMCGYVYVCTRVWVCMCVLCKCIRIYAYFLCVDTYVCTSLRVCVEWKGGMKWNENTKFCFAMLWRFACVCDSCAVIPFQINIFNLDKADSVKDIDRAILYALLKGESFCQRHFFPYLFQFVFWWNHYFGGVLSWLCHLHRHHHDGLCDCWLCGMSWL